MIRLIYLGLNDLKVYWQVIGLSQSMDRLERVYKKVKDIDFTLSTMERCLQVFTPGVTWSDLLLKPMVLTADGVMSREE